jgi:hypothetical protein
VEGDKKKELRAVDKKPKEKMNHEKYDRNEGQNHGETEID